MEEAPVNDKESSHSAHASGMNRRMGKASSLYTFVFKTYGEKLVYIFCLEFTVSLT